MRTIAPTWLFLVVPCVRSLVPPLPSPSHIDATPVNVANVSTGQNIDIFTGPSTDRRENPRSHRDLWLKSTGRKPLILHFGSWGKHHLDNDDFLAIIDDGIHVAEQEARRNGLFETFNYTHEEPWLVQTHGMGLKVWNLWMKDGGKWDMSWDTFLATVRTLKEFYHLYIPTEAHFDVVEGPYLVGQGEMYWHFTKPSPAIPPHPGPSEPPDHWIPSPITMPPLLGDGSQATETPSLAKP